MNFARRDRGRPADKTESGSAAELSAATPPTGGLRPWTYALWTIVALEIAISLVSMLGTSSLSAGLLALNFLRMESLNAHDSWGPMTSAIEYLRGHPGGALYPEIFFGERIKFQYPISSLLLPDLVQRLTRFEWETVHSLLNRMSWYSVWMTGFIAWRLLVGLHARISPRSSASSTEELHLLWPCLALTILYYPLSKSYGLGQIQTGMTAIGALALFAWLHDRKLLAGLCIGVCCAIKPQWSLILLWGALRREWVMVIVGGAACFAIVAASAAVYGLSHYADYLAVLSFLGQRGETYFPNQSVNGVLNRLLFNGQNLTFDIHGFPDFHPVVYAGTLITSVLLIAAALFFRWRQAPGVLDLALIMLAATMASPIAWEHHYGILLPIFAVVAPLAVAQRPLGRWTIPVVALAFVVASQRLTLLDRLADTYLNVLQSYLFFSAAVVLALLFLLSARGSPPAGACPPALPR